MQDILFGWMVGLVMYLLFIAHDAYQVHYAPVRSEIRPEIHPERSRDAE